MTTAAGAAPPGNAHLTTSALRLGTGNSWRWSTLPGAGFETRQRNKSSADRWAVPQKERRIGMVFQPYVLWPHPNVAGNALRLRAQDLGLTAERMAGATSGDVVATVDQGALTVPAYAANAPSLRVAPAADAPAPAASVAVVDDGWLMPGRMP